MSYFEPKRMRIVQSGYETYTGPIGPYEFVDGESVEEIPLAARDRLAVAFEMVEFDEESGRPAGPAQRLLDGYNVALESPEPLERQSDIEKRAEDIRAMIGSEKVRAMRTRENLENVADKMGIAGVRLVAEDWNVRSKSIPALIDMILGAQLEYAEARVNDLIKAGAAEDDVRSMFQLKADLPLPVSAKDAELAAMKAAAAVIDTPLAVIETSVVSMSDSVVTSAVEGDMAAALNQE